MCYKNIMCTCSTRVWCLNSRFKHFFRNIFVLKRWRVIVISIFNNLWYLFLLLCLSVGSSILFNSSLCFYTISSGIGIVMISTKFLISPLKGHSFECSCTIVKLNLLIVFHTPSTVIYNNSKHFIFFLDQILLTSM